MPTYDLALPDGRTLTLEAPDESTAMSAATDWHKANPAVSTGTDVAKGAGAGLAEGAINAATLPRAVLDAAYGAGKWVSGKLGLRDPNAPAEVGPIGSALQSLAGPSGQQVKAAAESVTGDFYKPQTTAGQYARTIGEFAPGALMPGGVARRVLGNVVAPAVGSEAAGQATAGTELEPYARLGGAVVGGLLPSAASRIVTPLPASAERTAAVNTLRNEGVTDITAGQATGRERLKYFESERGGRGAANISDRQAEQYTAAILRRAGENANRATPEVIDGAFTRIGQQFDDLAARNTLQVDRRLGNDIANLQGEYIRFANPLQKQTVNDAVNDIIGVVQRNNGVIPGAEYNVMRSRLGTAMRAARNGGDNQVADAFSDMIQALDDGMERSVRAAGRPADVAAWREARNQYRNLLVVERASLGAGEAAAGGLISPAKLRQAMTAVHGKRSAARGTSDFSDLSRAGNQVMTPLPNSGTAPRLSAQNFGMSPAGAAIGGTAGAFLAGPGGAGVGTVLGGYLPAAAGRLATSGPGRAYLGNQLLAETIRNAPPQLQQAILNSLLARPDTRLDALPAPSGVSR